MTSSMKRLILGLAVPAALSLALTLLLLRRRSRRLKAAAAAAAKARGLGYQAVAMQAAESAPVISTDAEFAAVWPEFEAKARLLGLCGLDCEWRWQDMESGCDGPGRLALIQLATADGCVLLVRAQQLTVVPTALEEFLADASVLKFGVGIDNDVEKLSADLGCSVAGWVDLRHLVDRLPADVTSRLPRRGLKPLARDLLDVDYVSQRWVARTDWELPVLTRQQIRYAALDALVGAMMPAEILALMGGSCGVTVAEFCSQFVDAKYKEVVAQKKRRQRQLQQQQQPAQTCVSPALATVDSGRKNGTGRFARQNPLYHNCQMLAPDGQLMCTLDRRKADWYTDRGLATIVSTDPVHAIRLNFEPSGRPTGDQAYYLSDKENKCVVCASEENLQRKKIIPDEYRRHFPEMMKSHKSHDILLLCSGCHAVSERHTEALKKQLIAEFDLKQTVVSAETDRRSKSLAKALLSQANGRANIPAARLEVISAELRQLLGTDTLPDKEQLQAIIDSGGSSPDSVSSGLSAAIVKRALDGGQLLEFERRWREHFLVSMRPRHLPQQWSVGHQHDQLGRKLVECQMASS